MKKIKYLIQRICKMNFNNMFKKVDAVHKKTNKNKIVIFFDMVYCGIKYQAGYMDYELFEMYNLNNKQRKTVLTRGKNNSFIRELNDKNHIYKLSSKKEFNTLFSKFLKRDWFDFNNKTEKEFNKFVKKHPTFMLKPVDGTCGKGIEKIDSNKFKNKNLYEYVKSKGNVILEEVIKQHPDMNKMYDGAINTCRVISILKDDEVHVVAAYLRIGNGSFVDNFNSGGMVVPVNKETGIIEYNALDKAHNLYEKHPKTNTKFIGFQIPMWKDVIKLIKQTGKVVPEVRMVGWDVGISDKGPVIVEANNFPGHDIYQLPPHRTNGIGVLPEFEKAIYGKEK